MTWNLDHKDLLGRTYQPAGVQLTMFCLEDFRRHYSGIHAVLFRENGEKISGMIDTTPQKKRAKQVIFMSENGRKFSLPAKHLTISHAADVLTIEVSEQAMVEQCGLCGLWESSYFPEVR